MTRWDRIKQMTPREVAYLICHILDLECKSCIASKLHICYAGHNGLTVWLGEEASEDFEDWRVK